MAAHRRVRFIEPGSRRGRPFNVFTRRWPLLGPILLATILDRHGYDVQVYNENVSGPVEDDPEAYQDLCSSDVVGFSVMTPTAARAYELADRIRADSGRPTLAFGGSHVTFQPDDALAHGDMVVRGEAENVITDIASGNIRQGIVEPEPVQDLDRLPAPNHYLMRDFDEVVGSALRKELYPLPVMTSRGCPHGCRYCSVTRMFGRRVRRQSVSRVHEDLQHYRDQGFGHVFFYDDNFTDDRRWTRKLLERMENLDMRFNAQARADFHWLNRRRGERDRELVRAMKRSGGDILYVGYETIDDSTAEQWKKGYGKTGGLEARLAEDTRALHEMGFWVHGMFILGPQHTESTASRIVDFAQRHSLESLQISLLTPFPGTPLMEEMRPHLIFRDFPQDWDYFDGTHCVYNHGRIGLRKLQNVLLRAHEKFYSLSRWSLRRMRRMLDPGSSIRDAFARVWQQASLARKTFKAWREETSAFLDVAGSKLARNVHAKSETDIENKLKRRRGIRADEHKAQDDTHDLRTYC